MSDETFINELVYCSDGDEYAELSGLILDRFPAAKFTDGSDSVHEYRFSVDIEGATRREFTKFALQQGFAGACLGIRLCCYPTNELAHLELLEVLAEVKAERAALVT